MHRLPYRLRVTKSAACYCCQSPLGGSIFPPGNWISMVRGKNKIRQQWHTESPPGASEWVSEWVGRACLAMLLNLTPSWSGGSSNIFFFFPNALSSSNFVSKTEICVMKSRFAAHRMHAPGLLYLHLFQLNYATCITTSEILLAVCFQCFFLTFVFF